MSSINGPTELNQLQATIDDLFKTSYFLNTTSLDQSITTFFNSKQRSIEELDFIVHPPGLQTKIKAHVGDEKHDYDYRKIMKGNLEEGQEPDGPFKKEQLKNLQNKMPRLD